MPKPHIIISFIVYGTPVVSFISITSLAHKVESSVKTLLPGFLQFPGTIWTIHPIRVINHFEFFSSHSLRHTSLKQHIRKLSNGWTRFVALECSFLITVLIVDSASSCSGVCIWPFAFSTNITLVFPKGIVVMILGSRGISTKTRQSLHSHGPVLYDISFTSSGTPTIAYFESLFLKIIKNGISYPPGPTETRNVTVVPCLPEKTSA